VTPRLQGNQENTVIYLYSANSSTLEYFGVVWAVMIVSTIVLPEENLKTCAHHWIITSAVSSKLRRCFEFACRFSKVFFENFDRDLRNFLSANRSARLVARAWIRIDSKRDRGAKPQEGFRRETANARYSRKWKRQRCIRKSSRVLSARGRMPGNSVALNGKFWKTSLLQRRPVKFYQANLPCVFFFIFFFC